MSDAFDEGLKFQYSMHLEELRMTRRSLLLVCGSGVGLLLLIVSFLLAGLPDDYSRSLNLKKRMGNLEQYLTAHPELRRLQMRHLLAIRTAPEHWAAFDTLAARAQAIDVKFGQETLNSLKDPKWVAGVERPLPNFIADVRSFEQLNKKFGNYTLGQFLRIEAPQGGVFEFVIGRQAAPQEQLKTLFGVYSVNDTEIRGDADPKLPMQPLFDRLNVPLTQISTQNRELIELYKRLPNNEPLGRLSFDGVRLELRRELVTPLSDLYQSILSDLRLANPAGTLYGKPDGTINESVELEKVEGPLRTVVNQELAKLDQRVQGAILGIPISLPIAPVLFALPLAFPFFALWVGQLYRKEGWHRGAINSLEKLVRDHQPERLIPLIEPSGSDSISTVGSLLNAATIPLLGVAALTSLLYLFALSGAWTLTAAVAENTSVPRWLATSGKALYVILAASLHLAVIVFFCIKLERSGQSDRSLKASRKQTLRQKA